jgi:hypothetical protein
MARKLPPDNSMRIVALVKGLDNVCCRYRVAALRPHLERAGHSLNILPWPASLLSRMLLGRGLLGAEVLILQRRMPPVWQLRLFRSLARFVIFDFDDAVFLRDSFSPQGPHCARRAARFRGVVRAADAVVAGNSFLRAQASLWAEPERLHMVPTCLELDRYPVRNIV